MSSSQAPRAVHQDYIARIRYTNTLPPPPNPPKLLDIPNTGLASGQYTTPGFASRLARDQPLNIEADAELGMPLDLVGMPGIFDGDESSIQAPSIIPNPHAHDRALLQPLSTLGKPKFSDAGVSFLRRTEYISSHTSKSRFDSTTSKSLISNTGSRGKKAVPSFDKESPEAIRKEVEAGFTVAANSLKNLQHIKHPTKRNVKLVDAYPLLPDPEAFADVGGFVEIKFSTNPVPPSSTYDTRLECGLLKPMEVTAEEEELHLARVEAYERDPERVPYPELLVQYEYFTVETPELAATFKRKFDVVDPDRDNDELYPNKNGAGDGCFRLKKLRAYEANQTTGSVLTKYSDEVVISLHDGKDGFHQKGAHYYPVVQRIQVRPQRNKHIEARRLHVDTYEADRDRSTDFVDLRITDPDQETKEMRDLFKERPWGTDEELAVLIAGKEMVPASILATLPTSVVEAPVTATATASSSQNVDLDAEHSDE